MRAFRFFLIAGLGLMGCAADETVAAYGGADRVWVLESLNGAAIAAPATLEFGRSGRVTGQAPCNRFSARQTVPYPWFALEDIVATEIACPDLDAETAYFEALRTMSQSEIVGNVLRLANEAGDEMFFRDATPRTPPNPT